jgi:hypothetical protein
MVIKKDTLSKVGVWAFTVGIILALLAGFIDIKFNWIIIPSLVVIGIIVGLLNISDQETKSFLMASVAIMIASFTAGNAIASGLASLGFLGKYLLSVISSINIVVFPATIVVALKSLFALSKD